MRILNVSALYPPHVIGGAELAVHNVSRQFAGFGHDVHTICLNPPSSTATDPVEIDGVAVRRVPLANLYWPYDPDTKPANPLARLAWHLIDTANPQMARRVVRLAREIAPDVILTHNLQGFSTRVLPALASLDATLVHVVHDFSLLCVRTALYRNGVRCGTASPRCLDCRALTRPRARHLDAVDGVIGVSQAVLDIHRRSGLFGNTPARVIHVPLRADMRPLRAAPEPTPDAPVRFGFLGRVDRPKGIETLLEAARIVESRRLPFSLSVAGSGSEDYVRHLRRRWPSPHVRYLGFVDPAAFLAEIDVLIFPSESFEALGCSVIEAYSQGVPVIATRCGGPTETVFDGSTGYLVEPGDSAAIGDAMLRLATDAALRRSFAAAALREVRGYTAAAKAQQFLEAIGCFAGKGA